MSMSSGISQGSSRISQGSSGISQGSSGLFEVKSADEPLYKTGFIPDNLYSR